jgi:hypothetical protein
MAASVQEPRRTSWSKVSRERALALRDLVLCGADNRGEADLRPDWSFDSAQGRAESVHPRTIS